MVKKVLTFAMGLVMAFGVMAQTANPVIPQDSIRFWTGTGANRAVISVTWNDATAGNVAVVWGVQWNGSDVSIADLMDTIAAYDNNLTLEHGTTVYTIVNNLTYVNNEVSLNLPGLAGWWFYNWKAADGTGKTSVNATADMAADGDFVDWLPMDPVTYGSQPADRFYFPTDPQQPVDAEIAASDILYWVGEGNNKVVFAINWADTALAWGYKFSTDSVYVSEIIAAIVRNDPRLSIVGDSTFVTDFHYADANITDTLTLTPHEAGDYTVYFNMQVNHVSSMIGAAGHAVGNGDFVKFADTYVAVKVDSVWVESSWDNYWDYTYVWPMTIHPVSVPQTNSIAGVESLCISVYPNPTADVLNVNGVNGDAVLYDMRGCVVSTCRINGNEGRLDLGRVANGVYMLRVGDATAKVVVRH